MANALPITPLQQVRAAVKANLLPGLVRWCCAFGC